MGRGARMAAALLLLLSSAACGPSVEEPGPDPDWSWFVGNWHEQPNPICPNATCSAKLYHSLEVRDDGTAVAKRSGGLCNNDEPVDFVWEGVRSEGGAVLSAHAGLEGQGAPPFWGGPDTEPTRLEYVSDCEFQVTYAGERLRWFRGKVRFEAWGEDFGCDGDVYPDDNEAIECWDILERGPAQE